MNEIAGRRRQPLTPTVKALCSDTASKLTAERRRAFMARVAVEWLDGSAPGGESLILRRY